MISNQQEKLDRQLSKSPGRGQHHAPVSTPPHPTRTETTVGIITFRLAARHGISRYIATLPLDQIIHIDFQMNSMIINSKTQSIQYIIYRRVSTEKQEKSEYKDQLRCIKMKYPKIKITSESVVDIKEVKSGCADAEIRMASGLGTCLRHLKRHPKAIMIVSNADRIARRAEIFLLIQRQELGKRIIEASTGRNLDQIIQSGLHLIIESQTEQFRVSRQAGINRRKSNGETVGSPEIGKLSHKASRAKTLRAENREAEILSVIREMVRLGKGHRPSFEDICEELRDRDIHTGQGRFFTPHRLSQLKKKNPRKWHKAFNSYLGLSRRIRSIIMVALHQLRKRRENKRVIETLEKRKKRFHRFMSLHLRIL